MKKIFMSILLLVFLLFSYLYIERDNNIYLYSELNNMFIDTSLSEFIISIYSNQEKSIYSYANNIKLKYIAEDNNILLNIIRIDVNKEDNLYRIDYVIENKNQFSGLYNNFKINLSIDDSNIEILLGNYYFYSTSYESFNLEVSNDLFNNLEYIYINNLESNTFVINGIDYKLSYDNTNFYLNLKNNYHNKYLLINIDKTNYLYKDESLNKHYLKEII